jgi:hypothetical protein
MIVGGERGSGLHWVEAFGFSVVIHAGLVFLVLDANIDLSRLRLSRPDLAEVVVTSLTLDAQTLADAQAAPDQTEPATPDLVPETPPTPAAETVAPVQAEPETAAPVVPETESLAAVAAEPAAEPEIASPVSPAEVERAAPISPLRPEDNEVAVAAAPNVERLTARPRETEIVNIAPAAPDRVAATPTLPGARPPSPSPSPSAPTTGSAVAPEVSELVTRIRSRLGDACLIAYPQSAGGDSPELVMLGDDDAAISSFATEVLDGVTPLPSQRAVLVDGRQCAALNFVRENVAYPAFRLAVSLEAADIASGEHLKGSIANAAGRYVSLLLIDDNGVVQDIGTYLTFRGGDAYFDVPLSRSGSSRDTSQLLVALASPLRPRTLDISNGQLAEDFFAALGKELDNSTALVMVPFNVR